MEPTPYQELAKQLDALPNGFPATPTGVELHLLAKLFTPAEASLAAQLHPTLETVEEIAARLGAEAGELRKQLKGMSRRGLIKVGRTENGLGFALLPFVVGIYEMQMPTMDEELARLFETYFHQGFGNVLKVQPQVHRVIPIGETVKNNMEIHPFETASDLVNHAQAWGVIDCICRKQKALIGEGCEHPLDVCMILSERPGVFDNDATVRALTREGALATLRRAAEAGLVHSVSNNQKGLDYICNCCTCSCGILRGMAELGIANVVARSAFVNQVDEAICGGCEDCVAACLFDAITVDGVAQVNMVRCVGCGACVIACSTGALGLVRRPEEEIMPVPETLADWGELRTAARSAR